MVVPVRLCRPQGAMPSPPTERQKAVVVSLGFSGQPHESLQMLMSMLESRMSGWRWAAIVDVRDDLIVDVRVALGDREAQRIGGSRLPKPFREATLPEPRGVQADP